MSKKGKKIALNIAFVSAAKSILNTQVKALDMPEWLGMAMIEGVKGQGQFIIDQVNQTPHQWFNDEGKIDKRKKRRHERKSGYKVHTARIIRVKG